MTPRQEAAADRRRNERKELQDRLEREGAFHLAAELAKCGQEMRMICTNCGHRRLAETRCKKRWCPSCAYHIAVDRVAKYKAAAERFEWPLFVTLTMRNVDDPAGLALVKKHWGRLRRRKLIREKVRSGIVGFEITNKGQGWHPHLHALLDCRWLSLFIAEPRKWESAEVKAQKCQAAAQELERLWAQIAGQDSASIKIRRGDPQALIEVLKYSVKGSDLIESAEAVAPLIEIMRGMRLITTFGEIRKEMKDSDPEEEETPAGCPCEACGVTGAFIPADVYQKALNQSYDRRNAR